MAGLPRQFRQFTFFISSIVLATDSGLYSASFLSTPYTNVFSVIVFVCFVLNVFKLR